MRIIIAFAAALAAAASYATNYEALVKSAESSGDGVAPISSIWQKDNELALAEATSPASIAECVADRDAADALLAGVKTAYETDPMTAFRIAEATHYVTAVPEPQWYEFWKESRRGARRTWTEALLARARSSDDDYVRIFCIDQLRWCAFPCQSGAVRALGNMREKGVWDFAQQVANELEGRRD